MPIVVRISLFSIRIYICFYEYLESKFHLVIILIEFVGKSIACHLVDYK